MLQIREEDEGRAEPLSSGKALENGTSGQVTSQSSSIARALRENHAVVSGSSCVHIVSLKTASMLTGSIQTLIGSAVLGHDTVGFPDVSQAPTEHVPNFLGKFEAVWQLWFSDGSGGPAKFGTCFYVQHVLSGRYLAFPPDVVNRPETEVAELPFVRAVLVDDPDKATVFFAVRGVGSVVTSQSDSKYVVPEMIAPHLGRGYLLLVWGVFRRDDDVLRCKESVRLCCRISKRQWWLGLPDSEGRLGLTDEARQQFSLEVQQGTLWLWNQRDAALQCEFRDVSDTVGR
jgi:hypothetical protein